jgi:uncharacterized protein YutE (UPF0331/DUF86 family)
MVHFYQEITHEELYKICTQEVGDVEDVLDEILTWINQHSQMIDRTL